MVECLEFEMKETRQKEHTLPYLPSTRTQQYLSLLHLPQQTRAGKTLIPMISFSTNSNPTARTCPPDTLESSQSLRLPCPDRERKNLTL